MTDDPRAFTRRGLLQGLPNGWGGAQWDRPEVIRARPRTFLDGTRKAIGDGMNQLIAGVLEKVAERIDDHSTDDLLTIAGEMATLQEAAAIVRKHRHLMREAKR